MTSAGPGTPVPGAVAVSSTREYAAAVKAALDTVSGRDPVHPGGRETGVDQALRSS